MEPQSVGGLILADFICLDAVGGVGASIIEDFGNRSIDSNFGACR